LARVRTISTIDRLRAFLDLALFPDAPFPPRITARRALVCAGIAVLCIAIQLTRMWSSVPLNSIWGEDGGTWLADALTRGSFDALTATWNGYLQTSSRLVAEPVALLPVASFAPAMAICGAAIVTGSAFLVWRASAGHIENPYLRAALAALVVLLPVVGVESLDNVTNSIWFLLFASFWVLLWRPSTFARAAAAGGFIFVVALSNAAIVVFAPLWLLRLIAIRDRRDTIIVTGFALGTAVQLAFSWNAPAQGEGGTHLSSVAAHYLAPHWDWSLVPAYAQRIVGGAVGGQRINDFLWVHLGTAQEVAMGLALLLFAGFSLLGPSRTRVVVPITIAASLGLFLAIGYRRWHPFGSGFTWPHGHSSTTSAHYMVTPTLLLLSALFVQLDARPRLVSAGAWNKLRVGTVLVVFVVALSSFLVGESTVRGSPTWSQAVDAGRSRCAHSNVADVELPVAPRVGFFAGQARIPCSELTQSSMGAAQAVATTPWTRKPARPSVRRGPRRVQESRSFRVQGSP
jgi:hypothetical protein